MSKAKKNIILIVLILVLLAAVYASLRFLAQKVRQEEPAQDTAEVSEEITDESQAEPEETAADEGESESAADAAVPPDADEWNLILVNPWNEIPDEYLNELVTAETEGGYLVHEEVKESLEQMMADCRDAGYSPQIISAFRTRADQQYLYDRTANKNDTAVPGHSEHECGLAVDIIDTASLGWSDPLIAEQEELPAQQWLMQNCQNYGFILRYPKEKEDVTGIIYEPWHYRYVGRDHAMKIMGRGVIEDGVWKDGICLEEYLGRTEQSEEEE